MKDVMKGGMKDRMKDGEKSIWKRKKQEGS
jgi:hypothetical protein